MRILLGLLIFIGVCSLAIYLAARSRIVFIIEFADGRSNIKAGRPSHAFVEDCEEICKQAGLDNATIKCIRSYGTRTLRFSRNIPQKHHQKFRNAFNLCR